MLIAVNCRLTLYLSPRNRLSCPTETSNRLRDAVRGGLWSSFSVPIAGTLIRLVPNCDARHGEGSGALGVARTPLHVNPAWNSWSALSGLPKTSCKKTPGCPPMVVDCGQSLLGPTP